jgi:2-polyprenyl-3-methyl-5-hydroxy-6-metoxy-1,4-benzoquinol methylase
LRVPRFIDGMTRGALVLVGSWLSVGIEHLWASPSFSTQVRLREPGAPVRGISFHVSWLLVGVIGESNGCSLTYPLLAGYRIENRSVYNPPMSSQPPSPMLVFETLQAHQRTSALRAGIELNLFTAVSNGARTPEALATACKSSAKGMRVLGDCLTILGFLTKDGSGYQLTPDSKLFLVHGSPAYMGGMVSFLFHPFMEKGLGSVTEAVRKGGTMLPAEGSVSDDNPVWVEFARGMAALTAPSAGVVAEQTAGSRPVKVLDIAAGHGMYGLTIAQRNPAAQIFALDWKNVLRVAHENAVKLGLADRWHAIEGSAFAADYGSGYDVVLVTNFIHHFDVPTNVSLLERIRAAMNPGGKMAIVEMAVDDDRIAPAGAGMFAMTMLTTTPTGDAYSRREIASMCNQAGFHDVTHHAVTGTPQTVTIASS